MHQNYADYLRAMETTFAFSLSEMAKRYEKEKPPRLAPFRILSIAEVSEEKLKRKVACPRPFEYVSLAGLTEPEPIAMSDDESRYRPRPLVADDYGAIRARMREMHPEPVVEEQHPVHSPYGKPAFQQEQAVIDMTAWAKPVIPTTGRLDTSAAIAVANIFGCLFKVRGAVTCGYDHSRFCEKLGRCCYGEYQGDLIKEATNRGIKS